MVAGQETMKTILAILALTLVATQAIRFKERFNTQAEDIRFNNEESTPIRFNNEESTPIRLEDSTPIRLEDSTPIRLSENNTPIRFGPIRFGPIRLNVETDSLDSASTFMQNLQKVMQECSQDFKTMCADSMSLQQKAQCLMQNWASLTQQCKMSVESVFHTNN